MNAKRTRVEQYIREYTETQDYGKAVELTLELYGSELLGFFMGSIQDQDAVEDIFQIFCLEIWRGLPRFEWRSSLRTWLYSIARVLIVKHMRDPYRRRSESLSTASEENIPMRQARTMTQTWRKTSTKNRLWELCAELPPTDRQLLLLRIGRQMAWLDIAAILHEGESDESDLKRASARLRKRFERLKNQLREQMGDDATPPTS